MQPQIDPSSRSERPDDIYKTLEKLVVFQPDPDELKTIEKALALALMKLPDSPKAPQFLYLKNNR